MTTALLAAALERSSRERVVASATEQGAVNGEHIKCKGEAVALSQVQRFGIYNTDEWDDEWDDAMCKEGV